MPEQNAILTAGVKPPETEDMEIQSYHTLDLSEKNTGDLPLKILLVDDEKEFVQTLSERLQMRNMGTAVVFDGESALDQVLRNQPEVMVIDLKMPGLDGMELLKQVKNLYPHIQIIVLTGHGSEQDKKKCMGLGAFSYLQKPVDINLLSQSLKNAYKKYQGVE